MPGFSFIYQHDGLDPAVPERTERLVQSSFKVQYITKKDHLIILFKDGINYPYQIIEKENYIILIEGKIYGINVAEEKLFLEHIDRLFADKKNGSPDIAYFHDLDGEFVIYVISRINDKILIINDYLGRLPLYLSNHKKFVICRDLFLMDKLTSGLVFEETAVYQYMRLGFPLGKRTLFYDIERLKPASLVKIEEGNVSIQSEEISLNKLENSFIGSKNYAENLYEQFRVSLKNRMLTTEKKVLSLSGGLDSRAILGLIEKEKYPVDIATFEYENPIIRNDVMVVRQFAKLYGRTPEILTINEWSPEFFDELTVAKSGMNYLGMSFILHFLRKISIDYPFMLTGDGGDKTLPYLFPAGNVKHLSKLILRNHQLSPVKTGKLFFLLKIHQFEDEIIDYLENIPEKSVNLQYKHFLLFERGRNWLFEGEDRNRSYTWSTSPFYSPQFFNMAHSVPEIEKYRYKLFRNFIQLIDPRLNEIDNANWGFPLSDQKKMNRVLLKQKIKFKFKSSTNQPRSENERHVMLENLIIELIHKGYGGQLLVHTERDHLELINETMLFHLLSLLKESELLWKSY